MQLFHSKVWNSSNVCYPCCLPINAYNTRFNNYLRSTFEITLDEIFSKIKRKKCCLHVFFILNINKNSINIYCFISKKNLKKNISFNYLLT